MELVNINELRPGYVVASAVSNKGGAVLVPVGFKLTQVAIDRLKSAGVASVIVQRRTQAAGHIDERLTALKRRFEGVEDPILLQLQATMESRLISMKIEQAT